MKIEFSTNQEGCTEATISDDSDWMLFNGIADVIIGKFKGKLILRLDGFDERYWDIQVDGKLLTLHAQHYLGITLFSKDSEANDIIKRIGKYLREITPRKMFMETFLVKNSIRRAARLLIDSLKTE